jgi:2-keto-4-pentenoate hydratase/2-oxohepta-3-ene-1,7-dioic acid hydratase in catechol pathway
MRRTILAVLAACGLASVFVGAQGPTPYKVGTFQRQGTTFVGVVIRDTQVINLQVANAAVTSGQRISAPADMKDLIARYDNGVRQRIVEIVNAVVTAKTRPAYVMDLAGLKVMPPIMYPMTMLNAAVNYREHAVEMAERGGRPGDPPPGNAPGTAPPGTTSASGIWERARGDQRWNPYAFLKSPSAIIASGEAILVPRGRHEIDWECELGVVVGKHASHVPVARAGDFIFGYTMEMDVSDRGSRGDQRYGSDWLIAKSHDTFAPMGPFITPKEFVRDPRALPVKFVLNGTVMQDATTALMIHDVFELVAYGSSILTLRPGDVIATGSPAGVGSARKPPIFLKPGDKTSCTYEGIGTLVNNVEAAPAS